MKIFGLRLLVVLGIFLVPNTYCDGDNNDDDQSEYLKTCIRVSSSVCTIKATAYVIQQVLDLRCSASNGHGCKSVMQSYKNVTGNITLIYSVDLELKNYDSSLIKVSVEQKLSEISFDYTFLETKFVKFPYLDTEKPNVVCQRKPVLSSYEHWYECEVGVPMFTDAMTISSNNNCGMHIMGGEDYQKRNLLYIKHYKVSVSHVNQECYAQCLLLFVIPANNPHDTVAGRTATDEVECKHVLISCPFHDHNTKTISCIFRSNTSFSLTKLDTTANDVTLNKDIVYSVSGSDHQNMSFYLKFGIKMVDGTEDEIVSELFEYKENNDPAFDCKKDEVQAEKSYVSTSYKCKINSISKVLQIKIMSSDYELECNPGEGELTHNMHIRKNVPLKIIMKSPICNISTPLRLTFNDVSGLVAWEVNYVTECPDPQVNIVLHDNYAKTLIWTITFPFKIYFFVVESANELVKLISNIQRLSRKGKNWIITNTLKYSLAVNETENIPFEIIIQIKASMYSNVITKTLRSICTQPLKKDGRHITCRKKPQPAIGNLFEQKLLCQIFSIQKDINLLSDKNGLTLTMGTDTKKSQNGGFLRENQEVTIHDNLRKCDWNEDVQIHFVDGISTISTIFAYESTCISPTISCHDHDLKQRTIKCNIAASFNFTSVIAHDVSKKMDIKVTGEEVKQDGNTWISELTISYDPIDLKRMDRDFDLWIKVFYNSHLVKNQTFTYEYYLREDEKPMLKCQEIDDQGEKQVSERNYSCSIISSTSDLKLYVEPTLFIIGWMKGQKGNIKNIFKWNSMQVLIRTTEEECIPQESLSLYFQDGDNKIEAQLKFPLQCGEFTESCKFTDSYSVVECSVNGTHEFKLLDHSCTDNVGCEMKTNDGDQDFKTKQKYQFDIHREKSTNTDGFKINLRLSYTNGLKKKVSIPVLFQARTAKVTTNIGKILGIITGIIIGIVVMAVIIVKTNLVQRYRFRRRVQIDSELNYLILETDNFDEI